MTKSRRLRARAIAYVLVLPLLAACSATIPAVNPTPNTALVRQPKSLEIAFDPAVEDRFDIVVGNYTVVVQAWHESLANGFRNGFRSAYPAKQGTSPDLTLRIDKARLELGNFDHAPARIQYAASLLGTDGTLRRFAGIASRVAPMFTGFAAKTADILTSNVAASISAMYEQVAKELFTDPRPNPGAARCIPGQSSGCTGPKGCQGFQVCANDGTRFALCSCGN